MHDIYRLPLSSARHAWEARTRGEWETEKCLEDISCPLTTFGELLTAQERPEDPLYADKLSNWEAGADKLGMMMNIAIVLTV
jgi:hypothetical protein